MNSRQHLSLFAGLWIVLATSEGAERQSLASIIKAHSPPKPVKLTKRAQDRVAEPPVRQGLVSLDECLELAFAHNRTLDRALSSIRIAEVQHQQAMAAYWPQINFEAFADLRSSDLTSIIPEQIVHVPGGTINTPPLQFSTPASSFNVPAQSFKTPATSITLPAGTLGPGTPSVSLPVASQTVNVPASSLPIPSQKINVPGQSFDFDAQTINVPQQELSLLDRTTYGAGIRGEWLLWDGGERRARRKQAISGRKAATQKGRSDLVAMAADVSRYYEAAILAKQLIVLADDVTQRMEANLELAKIFYEGGSEKVNKMDYLKAKTTYHNFQALTENLEGNYALACAALTHSVGLDYRSSLRPNRTSIVYRPVKGDIDQLLGAAFAFSPDWRRIAAGIEAESHGLEKIKAGYLPKLGVYGELHAAENGLDQGLATDSNLKGWSVGIGLKMPLFDGFLRKNQLAEAKSKIEKLKHERILLKHGIGLQLRVSMINAQTNHRRMGTLNEASVSASDHRDLTERAYRAGMAEAEDIFEAIIFEAIAKAQKYKSTYDAAKATIAVDGLVGREFAQLIEKHLQ